jgi:hypothetical protein
MQFCGIHPTPAWPTAFVKRKLPPISRMSCFIPLGREGAIDNRAFAAKGKLNMPVLAIGGEKSFGRQHSLGRK